MREQGDNGGEQLQDRLLEITNRQSILLEMVLEDMDNPGLSAQIKPLLPRERSSRTLDSLDLKRPTQLSVESRVAQIDPYNPKPSTATTSSVKPFGR